jgi:Kef-type K+ transport system membrane component KefB
MHFPPGFWLSVDPSSLNTPLAIFVIFGSAKLLAEVFERLRQPGIVGEILAGVLIGPSVLGWIQPAQYTTTLSQLGVMFLLFRVGLEVKSTELLKVGGTAAIVAISGVIAPFALGWGIMYLWGAPTVESIFVGAAMIATSVGITARILSEKGLLHHSASQVILAAAVFDDVLGLVVLAVVSSLARGSINFIELSLTAVAAIAFTLVVAKWGTRVVGRVVPHLQRQLRAGEVEFNLAMVALFGLALLATYAGVAAIIGAFLAGMALSESLQERIRDLVQGVSELLIPFFLVGIGLQMNLSVFSDRGTLLLTGVIVFAAVISKLIGCGLGAVRMGWSNALRVGTGMVPRGEVGMVVAQIGYGLGVIPARIYGVVVFMAVATTLIAPPMLSRAYRGVLPEQPVEDFTIG